MSIAFETVPARPANSAMVGAGRHAGAAPLRFEYTRTRVMPEARWAMNERVGVVKPDRSELAEAFKMLRNQVLQKMHAGGHRVLAVTSPRPVAGKSLSALNLALAVAADFDSTVLLVDADLSGTGLQDVFGLRGAPGLGDHLLRGEPLAELLVNPGIDRLVFLPAASSAIPQSAELLAARVTADLVSEMKSRYDDRIVIVDLPSALGNADALAFLPLADTTLVVIEEHTTRMADMEALAELLAPFELLGTVMSQPPA